MEAVTPHNSCKALASYLDRARSYAANARSESTRLAYSSDWATFATWCADHGLQALPASSETVALYLAARSEAGRKVSTLERALSSIAEAHRAAGHESPRSTAPVQAVLKGIRRTKGVAKVRKAPVLVDDLKRMAATFPTTIKGKRDRALLLLGFAGGFRRSELVALDVEDLEPTTDGLTITIRRSKTDQEAEGRRVGIPYGATDICPVHALCDWLEAAGIFQGPVFRSLNQKGRLGGRLASRGVAHAVKMAAAAAGLDPTRYSGHSLRAGLATSAARAGKSERAIMNQTGHRSVTVLRMYIREGCLYRENAAEGLL